MIIFLFTSFCLAFFLFPAFISLLNRGRILDAPDERKIHSNHTPTLGGVPIFLSVAFAMLVWAPELTDHYKYLMAAATLMFVVGLRDDIVPLHAGVKLGSQLIPFFLLIMWGGFEITSMYALVPGFAFPPILVFLITMFVFVVVTNAFNLIDGIDGLAGSIGLIAFTFFGIWFNIAGLQIASLISFGFSGAIIAFLFFNWNPSKVFMGDTGALMIGLVICALTILFLNTNYALAGAHPAKFNSGIGTALCVIIVPLTDTLRVFIIRISKGRSPFSADNNHVHHLLLQLGTGHAGATSILAGINITFILLAYLLKSWPSYVVVITVFSLAVCLLTVLTLVLKSKLKAQPQKASV